MEAATIPSSLVKSGFTNKSGGHIGFIVIENGQEKAMSARPDEEIFLNAEEQILTANAPKQAKNNPFENGSLVLTTPAKQLANRRPIGDPSMLAEGVEQPESDPEALKAAEERKRAEADRLEAEKARQAEAVKQAETGVQPRRSRPPAKSEGEGATEVAAPEETGTKPQAAGDAEGERAAAEEVGTPEAEE